MIRKANLNELDHILELCDIGRSIMRNSGNMLQWTNGYPDIETIRQDLNNGYGYMVERVGESIAYFAFIPSPEPTYNYIDGKWIDVDAPYYVIHRLASTTESHGVFKEVSDYALSICPNIKIDTHADNKIMQKVVLAAGYKYCGVIYLENGDPRYAYQLML